MTQFFIVATGPGATDRNECVIDLDTNQTKYFATRKAARAYRDIVKDSTPSKYYPLVVREGTYSR